MPDLSFRVTFSQSVGYQCLVADDIKEAIADWLDGGDDAVSDLKVDGPGRFATFEIVHGDVI